MLDSPQRGFFFLSFGFERKKEAEERKCINTPRHSAHLHAARSAPHYGRCAQVPVEMNPDVAAVDNSAWDIIMEYAREMI